MDRLEGLLEQEHSNSIQESACIPDIASVSRVSTQESACTPDIASVFRVSTSQHSIGGDNVLYQDEIPDF